MLLDMQHMQPYIEHTWAWLHDHPESGLDLPQTATFVAAELRSFGYDVLEQVGGSGLVAVWDTGVDGPAFALRADMDALPFTVDQTKTNYHGCGHDAHTTMLLAAAKELKEKDLVKRGTLVLVFQAGEEVAAGALAMLESGLLPKIDEIIAMHILFDPTYPVGYVTPNLTFSGTGILRVEFQGRSAHGSRPNLGVNATEIATLAVQAVNCIHFDPALSHSCKVTRFDATQSSQNTIPEKAIVCWDFRAQTNSLLNTMEEQICKTISSIADIFGAKVSMEYCSCPASNPSSESIALVRKVVEAQGARVLDKVVVTGGEDFNYFSQKLDIPSTCIGLAARATPGIHVYGMTFDHTAMVLGAAVYAGCAVGRLGDRGDGGAP